MIKNPPKEIEVFISVTLSKTLKIKVSDSNYNLYKEVEDQIILPQNAYDYIKGSELDTLKAQSLKEWDVDEIIIDNG